VIKFEDDNPNEKYEVIQNWNDPSSTTLISQSEYETIILSKSKGESFVVLKNGTLINLFDIKKIRVAEGWQSAEEKGEGAKNQYISDLWWKYLHARQLDEVSNTISFKTYLKEVLSFSDEKIKKIKERLIKTKNDTIKL